MKRSLRYTLNMKNFKPLAEILKNYEQRLLEWETPSSTANPINIKLAEMQIHHTEICHVHHTRTSRFLFWTQKKEEQVLNSTCAATWKTTSAAFWWDLKIVPLSSGRKSLPCIFRTKGKAQLKRKLSLSCRPSLGYPASSQRLHFKDLSLKFIFKFWRLTSMKAGIVK